MAKRRTVIPVQIQGRAWAGRPGNENMILQLGPRYDPPLDDTTILQLFHKTTDGGVSVLLERDAFQALAMVLNASSTGEWTHNDGQTAARIIWLAILGHDGGCAMVTIKWNGSGRYRTVKLKENQFETFRAIVANMAREGWPGWKSSRTGITPPAMGRES
jgi:hypothetical protein